MTMSVSIKAEPKSSSAGVHSCRNDTIHVSFPLTTHLDTRQSLQSVTTLLCIPPYGDAWSLVKSIDELELSDLISSSWASFSSSLGFSLCSAWPGPLWSVCTIPVAGLSDVLRTSDGFDFSIPIELLTTTDGLESTVAYETRDPEKEDRTQNEPRKATRQWRGWGAVARRHWNPQAHRHEVWSRSLLLLRVLGLT